MKHRILTTLLLILLVLALFTLPLATIRIEQDSRGVWDIQAPGIEIIYLPDQAGPVIWLYIADNLLYHRRPDLDESQRLEPIRRQPEKTVPATPTPVQPWPMELEQT